MIKVEDKGERINIEVIGRGIDILEQFSHLTRSLYKKGFPKEVLESAFELGLKDKQEIKEDKKDIDYILEDIKKIIKEAIDNED